MTVSPHGQCVLFREPRGGAETLDMAAGGPEHKEETLQTAFKKLRVDANKALVAAGMPETPRVVSVAKHSGASKDNWHGCARKASRGASKTPRRRRSESPILHPPKFTYSVTTTPAGGLKQRTKLGPTSPVSFSGAASRPPSAAILSSELAEKDRHGSGSAREKEDTHASDFGLLSKRRVDGGLCACLPAGEGLKAREEVSDGTAPCRCTSEPGAWAAVRAYSFTGLRDVISDCERRSGALALRSTGPTLSPASPRTCSSQALVSVDDVTMEDLAGYVEFYLYIPRKMSHMAEMMYT
ncbi:oxidative stress-responsive serine-rich protein 1 isoform 1-T2 [Syngnathus typhle]